MEDPIKITGVTEVCNLIADIYRKKMDAADYNKQGELYNFKWTTDWNGHLFEVYFDLPEYWKRAEFGRPAPKDKKHPGGWPPINEILKWIQHKKLVPRPSRKIPYRPRSSTTIPSPTLLAIIIANNIRYYGTEGKHLFEKTLDDPNLDKLADKLFDLITAEFEKEIEKEIQKIIK